jgi:Fibronectin type III domain
VSLDPTFPPINTLPLSETKVLQHPLDQETLITSNLTSKLTYYWRVGIRTAAGYQYAQARSFTTPAKNAALLPIVVPLVSPANQAVLSSTSVLLQWQNVPTALYYRVRIYDASSALFSAGSSEVQSPAHSLEASGLQPGTSYTWKVKALNRYGWGQYGAIYHFSVP